MDRQNIRKAILDCGATRCEFFEDVSKIKVYPEFRTICERNACGSYNTSWAGPPACGTVEECIEKIRSYGQAMFIQYVHPIEDSYDFEGMARGAELFQDMMVKCKKTFASVHGGEFLTLGAGCCRKCAPCTYPDKPCRFPEESIPSVEAFGLNVTELTALAGADYMWSSNKVYYAGMIFFNEEDGNGTV